MSRYRDRRVSDKVRSEDGPYAIVPVALLGDERVNDRAVRVYAAVASFADYDTLETFALQLRMAERLGVSVKTVQRGLQDLLDSGWILSRPRKQKGRKVGNLYTVVRHNRSDTSDDTSDESGSDTSGRTEATPLSTTEATHAVVSLLSDQLPRPSNETTCLPEGKRTDQLWEAVMLACGISGQITNGARAGYGKAVKELREAGATPDDVAERGRNHRQMWPHASLTPHSLAKHWAELRIQPAAPDAAVDLVQRMRAMEGR